MKLLDKFFKVFLANSLQIPIGIVTNIIVIRLLGPEDRGLYVLMVTIATMAAALTSLSLPTGSLFFYKKNFLKFNQIALINIFNLLTFISILSIFSIFFNEYLFQVLNISKISNYYLVTIICLIFITVILTFLHTMFLGKGMAKEYSIIILTNVISYFLLVIIFSLEESLNSFSATLSLLISNVISSSIGIFFFREILFSSISSIKFHKIRQLYWYSLKRYPSSIFPIFINNLPNIFLVGILGLRSLGIYSVALTAFNGLNSLPRSISTYLFGEISGKDFESAAELTAKSSRVMMAIVSCLFLLLSTLSIFFIPLIFGQDFSEAIAPTIVLMSSAIFVSSITSFESFFLSINRPGFVTFVNFLGSCLIFILCVPAIKSLGILGMPVIILISRILVWFTYMYKFINTSNKKLVDISIIKLSDLKKIKHYLVELKKIFS